jgi:hypothetical protein
MHCSFKAFILECDSWTMLEVLNLQLQLGQRWLSELANKNKYFRRNKNFTFLNFFPLTFKQNNYKLATVFITFGFRYVAHMNHMLSSDTTVAGPAN